MQGPGPRKSAARHARKPGGTRRRVRHEVHPARVEGMADHERPRRASRRRRSRSRRSGPPAAAGPTRPGRSPAAADRRGRAGRVGHRRWRLGWRSPAIPIRWRPPTHPPQRLRRPWSRRAIVSEPMAHMARSRSADRGALDEGRPRRRERGTRTCARYGVSTVRFGARISATTAAASRAAGSAALGGLIAAAPRRMAASHTGLTCAQTALITTEPSPTEDATRFTEPVRTSPTAKMPGADVSNSERPPMS